MSIALMNEVQALKERLDTLESHVRDLLAYQASVALRQQPLSLPNKDRNGQAVR
jgi:hypothetical protein